MAQRPIMAHSSGRSNFRFGSEAEIQTWGNRWERCLQGLIRIGEAGAAAPQRCHGHQQWLDQKSSARANGIQGAQPKFNMSDLMSHWKRRRFTFLTKLVAASGAVSVRAIPTNSRRPSASMRRVRCGSASRPGR